MKFNPGQYRKIVGGVTYIKDTYHTQVDPQQEEPQIEVKMSGEPSLEPVIEEIVNEIKEIDNDPIRPEQVEEKPTPKRTRTTGKRSGSSSKGN